MATPPQPPAGEFLLYQAVQLNALIEATKALPQPTDGPNPARSEKRK